MRFKKIKIKNIRSYKEQELEFPEGSLLLSGDIGSGKTTILLAIEYALFGLQPGQKGTSLLRNRENVAEVVLEIDLAGKSLIIERKLKRSPKGVSNEYSSITINGEKFESSVTEIKSKIVELLGYPEEFIKKNNILFRYTVFSPQEQMKQIILEDAEARLNILRHIFGIDKYKQIKNNLSTLLTNLKSESKLMQGEIKTLEEDLQSLELRKEKLSVLAANITIQEEAFREKKAIRESLESELKSLEVKIEEKKNFANELEKAKIFVSTKRDSLNTVKKEKEYLQSIVKDSQIFNEVEYAKVSEEVKGLKVKLESLNSLYISLDSKINYLQQEKKESLSKKEKLLKIDLCPICFQVVSENHKHAILNESKGKLDFVEKEIGQSESQKIEVRAQIESQRSLLVKLEDQKVGMETAKSRQDFIVASSHKLSELEKSQLSLEKDISFLIKHMESLKEDILKFTTFENHYRIRFVEVEKALLEEKNKEIVVAELKKELQLSGQEISLLQGNIQKKEETKKKLYQMNELIDWLSTQFLKLIDFTERNVLLKLRNEFSSLLRKWFLMLVAENSLDIRIDENFTPIILQRETEMDYEFLSGGERTAVALAYRLALNQIINSIMSKIKTRGIIILDEPTDGFSEEQISKIRDILEELNAKQLIIVSHEQKIESFVDNVFKTTKEGDVSIVKTNNL